MVCPPFQELADVCRKLGYESVLAVTGTVASRPEGQHNEVSTGLVEVSVFYINL